MRIEQVKSFKDYAKLFGLKMQTKRIFSVEKRKIRWTFGLKDATLKKIAQKE